MRLSLLHQKRQVIIFLMVKFNDKEWRKNSGQLYILFQISIGKYYLTNNRRLWIFKTLTSYLNGHQLHVNSKLTNAINASEKKNIL